MGELNLVLSATKKLLQNSSLFHHNLVSQFKDEEKESAMLKSFEVIPLGVNNSARILRQYFKL